MTDRRTFLLSVAGALAAAPGLAQRATRPTIVLRSSWQTVNIGDIGRQARTMKANSKSVQLLLKDENCCRKCPSRPVRIAHPNRA